MVVIMSMGYSKYISIISIMVYYERFKYLYSMLFALKLLVKCKVYMCVEVWKWFRNGTLGYTKLGTLGTQNKIVRLSQS